MVCSIYLVFCSMHFCCLPYIFFFATVFYMPPHLFYLNFLFYYLVFNISVLVSHLSLSVFARFQMSFRFPIFAFSPDKIRKVSFRYKKGGKNGIKTVYNCDFFAREYFSFHLSLFYQIDFCKFGENLRKVHN